MAEFLIRNSLNPYKVVKCGITFQQIIPKDNEGEPIWLVEVATDEPHKNGGEIVSEFVNLTSLDTLDSEIEKVSAIISAQVDWTPVLADRSPPTITSVNPATYEMDIFDSVQLIMEDSLPSAGIAIDSITMIINGFDVTSDLKIRGDAYKYDIEWSPPIRILDTY